MKYEHMRPGQIADAIARGLPLLMPVGVLEYHGHQNPIGVDALIAQGLVHAVAERAPCVVAPTIFYGFSGEWAAGVDKGEIHIDGEALYAFVKPILKAYYGQGWFRIYVVCHHQGPKGVTQLSYQRAASEIACECGVAERGPGWGVDRDWAYGPVMGRIHVVSDAQFTAQGYGGHGGRDETSAMLFFYPDTVSLDDLKLMDERPYWSQDAEEATVERGAEVGQALIESWVKRLQADEELFRQHSG